MKHLLLIIGTLMLAWPAGAASQWGRCSFASVVLAAAQIGSADGNIQPGELECFYFNAADNSDIFYVQAESGLICLDPNVATDGAATAEVMIRFCHAAAQAYSANTCISILDASLDGVTGSSTTQNSCIRVPRGYYTIVNTTNGTPNESVVSVQGE